jgi:thiol-disulfide isomerase/thioredoxin
LLVQGVVASYGGKARFVSENFGASSLAERFGVTRYPAVFVDDVLVARPRDFGFFAQGETGGRYTPWRNAASQAKFKADLGRMIDIVLAGGGESLRGERASSGSAPESISVLPPFEITDLAGTPIVSAEMRGRPVAVEFWATWCPPCRSTLAWLAELEERRGGDLAVVAIAVESPEDAVRKFAASSGGGSGIRWAIGDAAVAKAFGEVAAVPALFLFGRDGREIRTFYGAPPDLHEQIEKALAAPSARPIS